MKSIYKKGKPVVQDNGYGSCIFVHENTVSILLKQIDIVKEGNEIKETVQHKVEIHKADIIELLELMLVPGDVLKGEIIEYISLSPPDPNDTELFVSWNEDGTVERKNGQVVWRWKEYIEDGISY